MSATLTGTAIDTTAASGIAGGAEVAAYDASRGLALILGPDGVDLLDVATGTLVGGIPKSDVQVPGGGAPLDLGGSNSVAVFGDTVAVAFDGPEGETNGAVAFFTLNAAGTAATWTRTVTGPQFSVPDQLVFTPDGSRLLVAIEAEPRDDYATDGEGGIGIIDVATGALTVAGFTGFNGDRAALLAQGVRLNLPGATVAQDLEPEYVTVNEAGTTAYATLQEANAIAEVDIASGTVTRIFALGAKDHSVPGQGIDPSDDDGVLDVREVPVSGLYMPDGIASFEVGGTTYLVTANEGDARDFDVLEDEDRVADVDLDPTAFPNAATLQQDENLGRLNISLTDGDTDGDGDYDALFSFGARSFSIWEVGAGGLTQTFDSGDLIEQTLFAQFPALVDDGRSDNKGPEPESVTLGEVDGQLYAFVALERSNSVMAFEIEGPDSASFAGLFNTPGDQAPEVIVFVPAADAPGGIPLLIAPNEVSGTTTTYEVEAVSDTYTLQILHASDFEAGTEAVQRAPNFAAIVDSLEDEFENSITISSGDNFIPGPFTAAGTDPSVRDEYIAFYEQLLGLTGLTGLNNNAFNAVDIAILNAIGIQSSALGNHEFDLGTVALAAALDFTFALPPGDTMVDNNNITNVGALFPYLSANLDFSADGPLNPLFISVLRDAASFASTAADFASEAARRAEAADQQIAPWTTITEGGETIGVIGATTQILETISSTGGVEVVGPDANDMAALAAILQPFIDQMTAQGIDKIILTSHLQQIDLERELATLLSDVDIIFGGGSNTIFADGTDRLGAGDSAGGTYPEFYTDASGGRTALVNTDGNYNYVGRLVVTFDADGDIIEGSVDPDVSGAYVTDDAGVDAVAGNGDGTLSQVERDAIFADGTRGGEVKQLTDAIGAVIVAKDSNVLGFTDVFLDGRRAEVRTEETNFGNLTADANLAVAKSFDLTTIISVKNGGGIRAEIGSVEGEPIPQELPPQFNPISGKPEGGISQLDIENALRFNNALSLITLDAQGLLNAIENALRNVSPAVPGATNPQVGNFPQISGLQFSFDRDRPTLNRVENLAVVDQQGNVVDVIAENGELVGDAARSFRIVTLNFLAGGGDGIFVGSGVMGTLPTFASAGSLNRVDLDPAATGGFEAVGREQAALSDYLRSRFGSADEAFDLLDTPPSGDERVQNLDAREDTVIPADGPVAASANDVIVGTSRNDTTGGGLGDDSIYGVAGNDSIDGGRGDDVLVGGLGLDRLTGGQGDDSLFGGAGNDRLRGNTGNDVHTGGQGRDIFFLRLGNDTGFDTVTDFDHGVDRLDIGGYGLSFAQVQALLVQSGDDVTIRLASSTSVRLENTVVADFTASDFILI